MLPTCVCGAKAVPIPCKCGSFSCIDHGFFNRKLQTICSECAESLGYEEDEEEDWIWEVLSIEPTTDEKYIQWAFKERSKTCHPDKGGSDELFSRLQKAKEEALKYARGS